MGRSVFWPGAIIALTLLLTVLVDSRPFTQGSTEDAGSGENNEVTTYSLTGNKIDDGNATTEVQSNVSTTMDYQLQRRLEMRER